MDDKVLQLLAQQADTQAAILKELSGNGNGALHTKTPAQFRTANNLHGNGGLWSTPGLDREIITAHVRPMGVASMIPLFPSVDLDPRFGSLTGFSGAIGAQPVHACDDAPTGYIKGCNLTARFGRVRYDTNTIDIDEVQMRVNRADFTDLMLKGQVLGLTDLTPEGLDQGRMLNILTMAEMVTTGVLFEREITRQFWQGVTTVANEFPGLDVQIGTGQRDADTGALCPALDSDVKSYNYHLLDATIVEFVAMLEYYLTNNARRMGLEPVQWVFVMRPELWMELSAVWPCAYYTNKCASTMTDTNASVNVDGREMTAIRDSMRNGNWIEVNGHRYTVVEDDGIFEHNSTNNANLIPGEYASTIYFVPLSITGGFPVTYRQHVNYKNGAGDIALLHGKETFWTDRGIYNWALEQVKWCYKLAAKTEQRVVLRTPQLAGRIDAVKYSPMQHLRSPFADSPYFADGGVSLRSGIQVPYARWTSR